MSPSTDERDAAGDLHVLVAGGGSGGHVFPALAVGEEIRRQEGRVSFAGSTHGPEGRIVTARGHEFHALAARPVVGRGLAGRTGALARMALSTVRARLLVGRLRPDVVLGTGGYASVPAVLGAALAGRPIVLLEPNRQAGTANRFLSRRARGACVAHPDTAESLRCPVWETGVPVRREFFEVRRVMPPTDRTRLLVLGGSQGAAEINRVVPPALAELGKRGLRFDVTHQCGRDHVDATRAAYAELDPSGIEVEVTGFIDAMPAAIASHHLVVARAGAVTLAEICAVGRGAVLVPLGLAAGHQRANAETLAEAGAAVVLGAPDAEGMASTLAILVEENRIETLAAAAAGLGRPNAAADVVARLREVAA